MVFALTRQIAFTIGDRTLRFGIYVIRVATVIGYGLHRVTLGYRGMSRISRTVLLRQILFTGVEALPFTGVIALLTGLIVVVQAQIQLSGAGQTALLGKLLVIIILRELGPLIAALIILGRSGTAIAAELGTMRVSREIETLECLGIEPFEYLVVPRLGGVTVSIFCVTLFFVIVSLSGGFLASHLLTDRAASASEFVGTIAAQLTLLDVVAFLAKTLIPGLMIAAINCVEGLSAGRASIEVPQATTRGVVYCISAVFAWDALVTALVYVT